MSLEDSVARLTKVLESVPQAGHRAIAARGGDMFVLDFIVIGAIKRALSIGHGLLTMVEHKNMTCSRALVRMQLDTVSRLLAYTYVDDPEGMAKAIIGGKALKSFKSREGRPLLDAYLVERMSETYKWVSEVYRSTSGDVHFSEKQLFASITATTSAAQGGKLQMVISAIDSHYPESSWVEVVDCCSELCEALIQIVDQYAFHKDS